MFKSPEVGPQNRRVRKKVWVEDPCQVCNQFPNLLGKGVGGSIPFCKSPHGKPLPQSTIVRRPGGHQLSLGKKSPEMKGQPKRGHKHEAKMENQTVRSGRLNLLSQPFLGKNLSLFELVILYLMLQKRTRRKTETIRFLGGTLKTEMYSLGVGFAAKAVFSVFHCSFSGFLLCPGVPLDFGELSFLDLVLKGNQKESHHIIFWGGRRGVP